MKSKRTKRLNVSRETLASLEGARLQAADGGLSGGCNPCHASFSCPPPPTADEETCLC